MCSSKSHIFFSPNTSLVVVEGICETLDIRPSIRPTDDLGKYLGVPNITGRVTKSTFQEVVHRVGKRLAD